MYAMSLCEGYNINAIEMRSNTIKGYLEAVNWLFRSRGFTEPIDFSDKNNIATRLFELVKIWEDEPTRRTHMTPEFLSQIVKQASNSPGSDSLENVLFDWIVLSRYTGFRLS